MNIFDKKGRSGTEDESVEQERLGLDKALNDLREITMDDLEKICGGNYSRSTCEW